MSVFVDIRGDREAFQHIRAVEGRMNDLRVPMNITADLLEAHTKEVFRTRGRRIGRRWPKLAPVTIQARRRRWGYYGSVGPRGARPSGPPLVWSGRLRDSFTRSGKGHIRHAMADGLRWGSADPRAKYHDSDRRRTRLPQRKVLAFRDANQKSNIVTTPTRLWLAGVPAGAIKTVAQARTGLV